MHGDWASYDERGQWFLHGRSDDTLNIGGQRIGPAEAEAALTALPEVSDAAAIAMPHPVKGEAMWCFVVAAGEPSPTRTSSPTRSPAALGKPFRPERVLLVDDLPRTRSQKILRRVVRAVAEGEDAGDLSSLENPDGDRRRRRGGEPVSASLNGAAADGARLKVTCDVGGTFTDVVVADAGGRLAIGKALTTPAAAWSTGCAPAIESAAGPARPRARRGCSRARDLFVYATTQATNAMLEGKTARTALLCTDGFPDVLVRREGGSMHPYDFSRPYPEPYVPRRLTFEIPERIGAEGEVVEPLDERAARALRSAGLASRAGRGGRRRAAVVDRQPGARAGARRADRGGAARDPVHALAPAQPGRCASTAAPRAPRSTPR